ncbi:MAG: S-layer homology domain-containing protein [Lachnospiraceae bacterium]|nr:S-layer homology domain-containing protein [Lachnospiraceae bacterium]
MERAFEGCTALHTVYLSGSIEKIGLFAFRNCKKLKNVYYSADLEARKKITVSSRENSELLTCYWHYNFKRFRDIASNSPFEAAINWARENGITGGINKEGTLFGPDEYCTRGQIVTFLWRAAGSPSPDWESTGFTDVSSTSPFKGAIIWAVRKQITNGMTDTLFGVNEPCTRGQAVTFLYRYAGEPGIGSIYHFDDVDQYAFYSLAVNWAATHGITSGTSATTFSPDAPCTRAQIVTFLYRFNQVKDRWGM